MTGDVVNEAIDDSAHLRDSVFSRAFGADYIAAAFKRARKADPKATLFYNDYGIELQNAKSDAVFALVQGLVSGRVAIDGVGFQFHVDARFPPSEQAIVDNFSRFTALGLGVNISELDVQVRNVVSRLVRASTRRHSGHFRTPARACRSCSPSRRTAAA